MRKNRANGQFVSNCRICELYITHPQLWVEIHDRVNSKGISRRQTCIWLNQKFEEINLPLPLESTERIPPIWETSFQAHFSGMGEGSEGHEQDFAALKLFFMKEKKKAELEGDKTKSFLDEGYFSEAEMLLQNLNKGLTEYSAMSDMVESLEELLAYYDKKLKEKMSNGAHISIQEIETYQKQVSGLLQIKQDLSKLRNNSTIAGEAVHTAITHTITQFFELLMVVTDEAKHLLKAELPKSTLPDEIIQTIRQRLSEVIKPQGEAVFEKVMKQYKIK
jgi:hypothetical protein